MKKIIPMLLIIIVLVLSIIANIENKENIPDYTIALEEELRESKLIKNNFQDNINGKDIEKSGGTLLIRVEGLELLLEYLPPDAMLEYSDYMTVYIDSLTNLLNKDKGFYTDNEMKIQNIFGIYNYEKYSRFADLFSDIENEAEHVKLNNVSQNGALLKTDIIIIFFNKTIKIEQLLSYIYVENKPMLFIYTKI